MEDRFLSVARLTFSAIPTTSGASTISIGRPLVSSARISLRRTASDPTRETPTPSSRQASTAP